MSSIVGCNSFYFYIKPQRTRFHFLPIIGCNSFYFYIKPQRHTLLQFSRAVVIHSISTSNHNELRGWRFSRVVVIHSISTSNHNSMAAFLPTLSVVIHSISTSNHNTYRNDMLPCRGCNSFYFYIKPQHIS